MTLLDTLRAFAGGMRASTSPQYSRRSEYFSVAGAMALATIAVLVSRRTTTLTRPYVWAEDGIYIVPQYILDGWNSIFAPVSGYITVIPRILSHTALTFAPASYPIVSILLSWAFMAGVLAFIALAPTQLRARPWIAISCLLVPTEPEVFGTPLYSFWWAGLILMLLAIWEYTPRYFAARLVLAVLCSLSTPIAILVVPLMAARAALMRTRHDIVLAVAVAICAGFQIREILAVDTNTAATEISLRGVGQILDKFFGRFVWGIESANAVQSVLLAALGVGLIALVVYALASLKDRWLAFALLYLLAGAVAISVMRVPVEIMTPTLSGPRYFFYPYVLLGWILIQGLENARRPTLRALFAVPLALALVNAALSGWNRKADAVSWRQHVLSCTHFDVYAMPFHIAGNVQDLFRQEYAGRTCQALAAGLAPMDENELIPFTYLWTGHAAGARHNPQIESQTLDGASGVAPPERYRMIGTYAGSSPTGDITLNLRRGDYLMFATGTGRKAPKYDVRTENHHFRGDLPYCPQNCTLAFTSDLLPETFTVTFIDDGAAPDEWFALGVPID